MVGWWWSGDLCGDKRQYSDGISVDVESLIAINHHSESSRPNNDKQRSCYRGFSYSPRKIDYEMMVFEGFDDKKHGICTRRLTPWLKRVLWVPGGVLPLLSLREPLFRLVPICSSEELWFPRVINLGFPTLPHKKMTLGNWNGLRHSPFILRYKYGQFQL